MKKLLCSILAGCILSSSLISTAHAVKVVEDFDIPVSEHTLSSNEPTPEMMEAMIKKVRPLIDVPENYKEFDWNFNAGSIYNASNWRFSWTDNETGEISVNCDNDGNIYNYHHYVYDKKYTPVLPLSSPESFIGKAEKFIEQIAPYTKNSDFVLENIYPGSIYNTSYSYYFTRNENGIVVPGEQLNVEIDYVSGNITRFSSTYTHGVEFKKTEKLIGEDEAKRLLSEKQKMILSYRLASEYDDEGKLLSRKAYLVYTPETGYISVNAETGEIYTERTTWDVALKAPTTNGGAFGDIMMDSASKEESASGSNREYELSEEELAQLAVLESLISKDEAIEVITGNKDLYIDEKATVVKAHLRKQSHDVMPLDAETEEKDSYVWNIEFTAPEVQSDNYPYYYYHNMSAVVDANTGELISFFSQIPDYYYYEQTKKDIPENTIDEEKAKDLALAFITKMQPQKAQNVSFSSVNDFTPILYTENEAGARIPTYGAKRFNFVRQNEGIDFTYNNFRIGVELNTGKITSYSYTWYDDVEFESPKDAISAHDALMSLYSYDGFGINYEVNAHYTYNEYKLKENNGELIDYDELFDTLVYSRPVYSAYGLGTTTIRAIDGKMIDYSGEEYKDYSSQFKYNDIDSHWAKETIQRFSWIGIGFNEENFLPNAPISGKDFENLCSNLGLYNRNVVIEKDMPLTRMQAVKHIVGYLGYSKIAELENVFITDFLDNADFLAEDVGYAAIARGFKLIEGDGETFRPYDTLTRAEAYTIAANMIDLGMLEN